jgi:hypothetical protein
MKTRIGLATIALVVGGLMGSVPSTPMAAAATDDCLGLRVNKVMPWGQDATYSWPDPLHPMLPRSARIRLVATLTYAYCPNSTRADKVMPLVLVLCHLHISRNSSIFFDGVKMNPYMADDNYAVDPPEYKVDDGNGGEQVCLNVDISRTRWLKLQDSAGMSVSAWIVLRGLPDQHVDFTWLGSTTRYFHPLEDANISGWY